MKSRFDYIESRLQALIENRFTWLPWRSRQPILARQIVAALRSQVFSTSEDSPMLPNLISFHMHPENVAIWQSNQDWLAWLSRSIQEIVQESGARLAAEPAIHLVADPALGIDGLHITAGFQKPDLGSTAAMNLSETLNPGNPDPPASFSAYLILNGSEIYPLNQPVVNIGRRPDNHIVIDDLRISRSHAQIRELRGQHVLFDLNSTGGSFINGNRITEYTLRPGDVISLAGVTIIYGQETDPDLKNGGTSPADFNPIL